MFIKSKAKKSEVFQGMGDKEFFLLTTEIFIHLYINFIPPSNMQCDQL